MCFAPTGQRYLQTSFVLPTLNPYGVKMQSTHFIHQHILYISTSAPSAIHPHIYSSAHLLIRTSAHLLIRTSSAFHLHIVLRIHLPRYNIQTTHCNNSITQHTALNQFSVCLVINKARPAKVKPVRRSTSIGNKIKSKFTISPLH